MNKKNKKKNKLHLLNRLYDLLFPENKLGYIKSAKIPGGHNRGFAIWLQVVSRITRAFKVNDWT